MTFTIYVKLFRPHYTSSSPLEIRPLLIFYGMLAFAKAIAVARTLKGAETLPANHGLTANKSAMKMEHLSAKVDSRGTFQNFNNAISSIQKTLYGPHSTLSAIYTPTANSDAFVNKVFSIKDVLSRIPKLENLYTDTFQSAAKVISASLFFNAEHINPDCIEFQIYISPRPIEKNTLRDIIRTLRSSHIFLNKCCFMEARLRHDVLSITFSNIDPNTIDELSDERLTEEVEHIFTRRDLDDKVKFIKFEEIISPRAGELQDSGSWFIEPFHGLHIAEASYYYLGMFILSSVVRYQPQVWVHSLTGSFYGNTPPDDAILALIERFLSLALTEFPKIVLAVLKEPRP